MPDASVRDQNPLDLVDRYRAAGLLGRVMQLLYIDDVRTASLSQSQFPNTDVEKIENLTDTMKDLLFDCAQNATWVGEILAQHAKMFENFADTPEFNLLRSDKRDRTKTTLGDPKQLKALVDKVPDEAVAAARALEEQMLAIRRRSETDGDMKSTARCALYGLAAALAIGTGAVIMAVGAGFAIGMECL